jgi:hypothetical protein
MILGVNKLTELSGPKINQTAWFSEFIRSFQSENLEKKKWIKLKKTPL